MTARPLRVLTHGVGPGDRRTLRRVLVRDGLAPVVRATRSRDALRAAALEPLIDLVICGHAPAVTDGLAALKAVRQVTAAVPVVVVSRGGDEDTAVAAIKGGATDYIPWPPDVAVLRQALFDALGAVTSMPLGRPTARFEHLLDQLDIGIFRMRSDGTVIEANDAMRRILRQPSVEALLRPGQAPAIVSADRRRQLLDMTAASGIVRGVRERLSLADGTTVVVEGDARAVRDERGRFLALDGSMYDITARAEAEATVNFQASLLDQLRHVVVAAGPDFKVVYWNRHARVLLQRTADEVMGGDVARALGVHDPDAVRAGVDASLMADGHWTGILEGHRRDGTPVVFQARGTRLEAEGRHFGYLGMLIDITEQRRLEQELEATIAIRDRLLRDVHDRVRRTLRIVSRLMHLQQQRAGDPVLADLFRDSGQRIRAIALIHDWLSPAAGPARVNMHEYLAHLVEGLQATTPTMQAPQVRLRADPLALGLDTAVRMGLIVNELVTNALKHAFVDGRAGTVRVELRCAGTQGMVLDVVDDGVGLPPGTEAGGPATLGLPLVRNLAAGLRAAVHFDRQQGTRVRIAFPPPCAEVAP